MSSFQAYTIGFLILIVGVCLVALLIGVPAEWIGVGALILLGIGVISAVATTKRKDAPDRS